MIRCHAGPVHLHDCRACRFLGTTGPTPRYPGRNAVDHYLHRTPSGATLIQRGSSVADDYLAASATLATSESWSATRYLAARLGA